MKKEKTHKEVRDYRIKIQVEGVVTKKALNRHFQAIRDLIQEVEFEIDDDWDMGHAKVISIRGLRD